MNTYDAKFEFLIFGDYMACEIFDAAPRSDGVAYLCRHDDYLSSIVAKMEYEVAQIRPRQVVVFAGNQDAIMGMQEKEYEMHISWLLQFAQTFGVNLIFVVPLPCGGRPVEQRLGVYRRVLRKFATGKRVQLLDLYGIAAEELWDGDGERTNKRDFLRRYYADDFHLNKAGKERMCQIIDEYFWGV